jgi:hypothetical protein
MLSVVAEHVSLGHAVKYKCKYLQRIGAKREREKKKKF